MKLKNLAPTALAIVSLTILIGVGSVVLGEMEPVSYTDNRITNEVDQPSTPLPSNFTLDASNNADYVQVQDGSVTVVLEDSSAGTNTTLTEDTDYEVYYSAGEVELKSSPGGISYNTSEGDQVYTDYTTEEESTATTILGDGDSALETFSNFFTVIVVVAVAVVIFGLLSALRSAGNRSMA